MKTNLFIGMSLMAVLSGCVTEEEIGQSEFKALSFETFVGKGTTRAIPQTAFADGDNFGVIAYTHGAEPWKDGIAKTKFMDNVKVSRESGTWTYSPTKYWEEGTKHTFFAYSPYDGDYIFADEQIIGITTAANASDQVDLLYSIPETGSKDLEWTEGKKVVMTFRHALSQIRISAATDQDYSGYYTATIKKVELKGIGDVGNLNLNTADAETSPWSGQGIKDAAAGYVASTGTLAIPLTDTETLLNADDNLFMLLPQEIANTETATLEITYDIRAEAAGNASNNETDKVTVIKIPMITWEHNRIYNYKIKMDLQQLLNLKPVEIAEPEVVEWEVGGETKLPEDLTVTIVPSATGDAEQIGKGNATLGITKSNEAGGTQTVKITNPEKADQWIVEVGPEITDATVTTRAGKEPPADWLKVCKEGDTEGVSKLYGKEDATVQIKITEANSSLKQRKAEVVIKRALSGVTRIVVTQEKAPAALIEANSTQFTMEGETNRLTIINTANASWTLSKSKEADWLSLEDKNGSPVTSGTAGQVVMAKAAPNYTTAVRTAVITLEREGQDPVLVEVTQAVSEPMIVSETNFLFPYSKASKTLTISNPEGEKSGFLWTLEGTVPDWLKISQTQGTATASAEKVVFETVAINENTAPRSPATFTLTRQGQEDILITVNQEGAVASTLSATAISADYSAQNKTFDVISPAGIPWILSSNSSWMTFNPASGTGTGAINIAITENTSTTARDGTVILTRSGQSPVTLTLTQGGKPAIKTSINPTTINERGSKSWTKVVTVTAAPGTTWKAAIDPAAASFKLYPYLFFSNNEKSITGTGSGSFTLKTPSIPSGDSYIAIIRITSPGNDEIKLVVAVNLK